MRAIFISYRREDAEGQAGRLYDDLVSKFGENSVFMDVVGIDAGRDFRKAIDENVASCGVLLAIIGRNWLNAKYPDGRRRLDDSTDFVRLETSSALKRDIPVIPVLVQGAVMPRAEELPEEIKDLAYRNAVELTHARWDSDMEVLARALRRYIVDKVQEPAQPTLPPTTMPAPVTATRPRRRLLWSMAALAVLFLVGILSYWLRSSSVQVPSVMGLPVEAASRVMAEKGLEVSGTHTKAEPGATAGTVVEQSPVAGTRVKSGSQVQLAIAASLVKVPKLTGKSQQQANDALQAAGLTMGTVDTAKQDRAIPGVVVSQVPAAGMLVAQGSSINVTVVEGDGGNTAKVQPGDAAPVAVPDLTGRDVATAVGLIRQSGLLSGDVEKIASDRAPGIVLSQNPSPGTRVLPGSAVTLTVSALPSVTVPNVLKWKLEDAEAEIQKAGLVPVSEWLASDKASSRIPKDAKTFSLVAAQSPTAGEMVSKGQGVSLQYIMREDRTAGSGAGLGAKIGALAGGGKSAAISSAAGKELLTDSSGGIAVSLASYGQNCGVPSGNATADVQRTCDGSVTCTYPITIRRLGDPAPSCAKVFTVYYSCAGRKKRTGATAEANGQSVVLQCP